MTQSWMIIWLMLASVIFGIFLRPPFMTPIAILLLLGLILLLIVRSSLKSIGKDEQLALDEFKESLEQLPYIERFAVALAQPLRGIDLVMPLQTMGTSNPKADGSLLLGCLDGQQALKANNVISEFSQSTGDDLFDELTQYMQLNTRMVGNPIFNLCYIAHIITCVWI